MTARLVMAVAVLLATLLFACDARAEECFQATVTAYSAEQYPGRTADGTSTVGALADGLLIVAGGAAYDLGDWVWVAGNGPYRVADRGHLAPTQLDLLMATTWEALQWGVQTREVCRL